MLIKDELSPQEVNLSVGSETKEEKKKKKKYLGLETQMCLELVVCRRPVGGWLLVVGSTNRNPVLRSSPFVIPVSLTS